jgi:hypothetical protein
MKVLGDQAAASERVVVRGQASRDCCNGISRRVFTKPVLCFGEAVER